ncbi:MAG: PEP-CTERM sorting domain-containing protein [Phycisphaerae bacterium]|nr:PEP-CTERM sorting domain-containing protein [Phycisphaerae bacterium]
MFTRGLLVAAVCAAVSLPAAAGISPGTGQLSGINFVGGYLNADDRIGFANDGKASSSLDFNQWCAVVWAQPQWFDLIIVEQYYSGPFAPYVIEVAYTVPNGWTQADGVEGWAWTPWVGADGSTTFNSAGFTFSPGAEIAGVRFVRSEYLWHLEDPVNNTMTNFSRIREIWAFEKYEGNLSSLATFSAVGWTGGGTNVTMLKDMNMMQQIFATVANDLCIYVDFRGALDDEGDPLAITIDGFMIAGGYAGELMGSFALQYSLDDGSTWTTAFVNTTNEFMIIGEFAPITASYWRFNFTAPEENAIGWSGNYVRVTEIMMFAPIPEPATMSLLALGGLALLRRRR